MIFVSKEYAHGVFNAGIKVRSPWTRPLQHDALASQHKSIVAFIPNATRYDFYYMATRSF